MAKIARLHWRYLSPGSILCNAMDDVRGHDISYGIFLHHMPILMLLMAYGWTGSLYSIPVLLGGTCLAAFASWKLASASSKNPAPINWGLCAARSMPFHQVGLLNDDAEPKRKRSQKMPRHLIL